MINHSLPSYIFIRICICLLQSIPPLSIAYTAYCILLWPSAKQLPPVLHEYLLFEAAFFAFFYLPFRAYLQRDATHPPLKSKDDRRELFRRVVTNTKREDVERHVRFWFKGAEFGAIGRENMKRWLDWALFEGRSREEDEQEIEGYVKELEGMLGKKFLEGKGTAVPLRLTLDPIEMRYRSLVWYAIVALVDTFTSLRLRLSGFRFYRQSLLSFFKVFPPRPIALTTTRRSPEKHLSYWYRPHKSKKRLPIVFIHGIGIGLHPYVDFLRELRDQEATSEDGQIGILAIELLPISFRLTSPLPPKEQLLASITKILSSHNITNFTLITHSYGSLLFTHMLSDPTLSPKISSALLIDPVTFLLHTPDVAYNFTVRRPRKANEWQLWYFASKDPMVAYTLGRHFHWAQNALWLREELVPRGMRVTVGLSARDLIVDAEAVGRYIAAVAGEEGRDSSGYGTFDEGADEVWKRKTWRGEGTEILWFDDTDHAQVFETKEKRRRLLDVVEKYTQINAHT